MEREALTQAQLRICFSLSLSFFWKAIGVTWLDFCVRQIASVNWQLVVVVSFNTSQRLVDQAGQERCEKLRDVINKLKFTQAYKMLHKQRTQMLLKHEWSICKNHPRAGPQRKPQCRLKGTNFRKPCSLITTQYNHKSGTEG